jgi:putative metalloprotease
VQESSFYTEILWSWIKLRKVVNNHSRKQIIGRCLFIGACLFALMMTACGNTDMQLATEAGMDAIKAATLSDKEILEIAVQSAKYSDGKSKMAPPENRHAVRLQKLVGSYLQDENIKFNYAVYLSPEVNAFAMADGTIRIYSGLMDMLTDGELRFVIGHEMGHVAKNHIRKKIQLGYAASAVRKGIASQTGVVGDVARSAVGDFAQTLMNAQFSQLEEKEADDFGLGFLKRESFEPRDAVGALRKIATLGGNHSFLSSHPDPVLRADRLQAQLEGKTTTADAESKSLISDGISFVKGYALVLSKQLLGLIPGGQQKNTQ